MRGSGGEDLQASLERLAARLAAGESRPSAGDMRETVAVLHRTLERMRRLSVDQSRLEERVARIENSVLFRFTRGIGRRLRTWKLKFRDRILDPPFEPLAPELPPFDSDYEFWFSELEQHAQSWEWHRQQIEMWGHQPLISVVMVARASDRTRFEAALRSVFVQSYPHWEVCICVTGSPDWVPEFLAIAAKDEGRLRWQVSYEELGQARAWNEAANLARGEYLAFLRPEDTLSPLALHYVAEEVRVDPADIIYTDEDFLNSQGRRVQPLVKPDWSPDLLLSCMYLGHLLVLSKRQWDQLGGFRSQYEDAQEYDAVLRITDGKARIRHVARVLHHSSAQPTSTVAEAECRVLEQALWRRRINAQVLPGRGVRTFYVQRRIAEQPSIAFVICSCNRKLLARCLEAITPVVKRYDAHLVVVHHETARGNGIPELVQQCGGDRVPFREPFNFSRMNNLGTAASRGNILFFLNDDISPLVPDWVDHLLAHLQRPEVGVVGAKLLYPSGAIQHAGVVLGMSEGAGHAGRGAFRSERWRWLDQTRNVSAVTGACMGIRRSVFTEAGGFNTAFPVNFNDIDLCLRVRQLGYEVIYEPRALLRHDECQSRAGGTRLSERELFHDTWGAMLSAPDPYYSPLLELESEQIELRPMAGGRK